MFAWTPWGEPAHPPFPHQPPPPVKKKGKEKRKKENVTKESRFDFFSMLNLFLSKIVLACFQMFKLTHEAF
jgi:hypothetical protein